jgi:hypothetical protein
VGGVEKLLDVKPVGQGDCPRPTTPRRSERRTPCQRFAFGAGDTGAWRSQDGFCGARAATSAKPVEARFPRKPARPITPGLVVSVAETTKELISDFLTPRRCCRLPFT